jgi:hypothetical protein
VANTYFGSKLTNKLSTESPRQFLEKLGEAAVRSRTGASAPRKAGLPERLAGRLEKACSAASSLASTLHVTPASAAAMAGAFATVALVRRSLDGSGRGSDDLTPSAL